MAAAETVVVEVAPVAAADGSGGGMKHSGSFDTLPTRRCT